MNKISPNLVVAKTLAAMGIDIMFGVMGDAVMHLIDNYVNDCGGRYIKAGHESAAVQMAIAYSQLTDKVGVATCTCGPGFANTIGALMEGRKSSTPVVLVTAGAPSSVKEHFQTMNHGAVALACGVGYVEPVNLEMIQESVIESLERAKIEQRPVVLNLPPYDLLRKNVSIYLDTSFRLDRKRNATVSPAAAEGCAEAIANARRPLILAGYGAIKENALDQIKKLADRIDAPIATTLRAKDSFIDYKWNLGIMGSMSRSETLDVITKSDCIIAIGTNCNQVTSAKGTLIRDKTLVMIGTEMQLMYRFGKPKHTIRGDIFSAIDEVIRWLDEIDLSPSGFAREHDVVSAIEKLSKPRLDDVLRVNENVLTLDVVSAELNDAINEKIVVTDAGRFTRSVWTNVHASKPQYFLAPASFGSIGMGIGHAIGAALAVPEVPVLAIIGDGGFMLGGINEVFAIKSMALDIITVIINDETYGAEYAKLVKEGRDPEVSNIRVPPLVDLAKSMGFKTMNVKEKEELLEAMNFIKQRDKKTPIFIEIQLSRDAIRFED